MTKLNIRYAPRRSRERAVLLAVLFALGGAAALLGLLDTLHLPIALAAGPTVQFSANTYTVTKTGGSATITVTLSASSVDTITVDVATSDGSASSLTDYAAVSTTLTFDVGDSTITFTVPITDDAIYEGDRAFSVTLSNPTNGDLGAPSTAAVTIQETNAPPTLSINDSPVTEGALGGSSSAVFTVSLSGATALPASVNYSTSDTTATAGSDYLAASGTITIPAGAASQPVTVTVQGDDLYENNETFKVTLASPTHAAISDNQGVGTITNDDSLPLIQFTVAGQTVSEDVGVVTVTVNLNTVSGLNVSVPFTVSGTAAGGGTDHNLTGGNFSIPAGSLTGNTTFTVNNDLLDEDNEAVIVTLGAPTNAASGATTVQTITINDDDLPPVAQLSTGAQTVNENVGTVTATLNLSAPSGLSVTVPFNVSGTAAGGGTDHNLASGNFNLSAGATTASVNFAVNNDSLDENNETVIVTLGTPTNATPGATTVQTITINDDDLTPTAQLSSASQTVAESAGVVTATVNLSAASGLDVTVPYTVSGTAAGGADHDLASGNFNLSAGATTASVNFTLADDALSEDNETVIITLGAPTNAALGATTVKTITITDNDPLPTVQLSAPAYAADETDGAAVITATLSAPAGRPVTVNYATSNGTALAGSDYTTATGTITFTAGSTSATFNVPLTNDLTYEEAETFGVTLSAPANATLGPPSSATVTIASDDPLPAVRFSLASFTGEEVTSAPITVTLSNPSVYAVTVNYATSDGTATIAAGDYTSTSGALTFAPGVTSQSFSVSLLNDATDEPDEYINLTLTAPVSATLGSPNPAQLVVVDTDGTPSLGFAILSQNVNENAGPANVIVSLGSQSAFTITVAVTSSNGSAIAGSDYTAISQTLTIPPGDLAVIFGAPITNDTIFENTETFTLTLGNAMNAVLSAARTVETINIVNDDPQPIVQFSSAAYSAGEDAGAAVITATLSNPSALAASVNYATSDGTALNVSDYQAASGTLTFSPGMTVLTFTVPVTNDTVYEGNEALSIALSDPVNTSLSGTNPATLTLVENDPQPTVQFSAAAFNGGEAAGPITITATLIFPAPTTSTALTTTVGYATSSGSALALGDYTTASGTLTFAPGVTSQAFDVTINDDSTYEGDEYFNAQLNGAVNAALGAPGVARVNILENDPAPVIQFNPASVSEDENAGSVLLNVSLTGATAVTATVNYATGNGTAVTGSDFTPNSGTLTFAPGDVSKTIAVSIVNDSIYEGDEAFGMSLTAPISATLNGTNPATITIVEDDAPPSIQFSAQSIQGSTAAWSVGKNQGSAVITARLTGSTAVPAQINFATSNSTALAGVNYTATSGQLTFNPGTTTLTFTVPFLNIGQYTGNRAFNLTLSSPISATLGVNAAGVVTIAETNSRAGCVIANSANVPLTIPPNGTIESQIVIPGPGLVISDVTVRIDQILYPYTPDLRLTLIAPFTLPNSNPPTNQIKLLDGGIGAQNFLFMNFNDTGSSFIGAQPPFTGTFRLYPNNPSNNLLAPVRGQASGGTWKLRVVNTLNIDTGTLNAWSIEFCGSVAGYKVFLPLIRR